MEEFRKIPGYSYEVSNFGRIRNGLRILKGRKDSRGYLSVCLYGQEIPKNGLIHRLVAAAFLENPYNLETVDHINRDKLDNSLNNLRYADYTTQNLNRQLPLPRSGHQYISFHKGRWRVRIIRYNQALLYATFKTLEEAIAARDEFLDGLEEMFESM